MSPVAVTVALADADLVDPAASPPLGQRRRPGRTQVSQPATGEAPEDMEIAMAGGQDLQAGIAAAPADRATGPRKLR